MERVPEPELMLDDEQARAYAEADFEEAHQGFVRLFGETFPEVEVDGVVLDLGCGPADVTIRFAHAYPDCVIHGIDGSPAMLRHGREAVRTAGLEGRIELLEGLLPHAQPPLDNYDVVISNSLLHHLGDAEILWHSILEYARAGTLVFVMDLMRPASVAELDELTARYASEEPEVLRHDFRASLRAAYTPDEVRSQLDAAGLQDFGVRPVSDRHLVVAGRMEM